jgi:ParB-like chromosome segregation protein Spo0J
MNDEEADLVMLAENVQRVNLNPVEEAMGFQKQLEKYGRSRDEIAARCNVSVDLVRRRLGLLKLNPDVQHQVATGNLRVTYAECMIGLDAHRQTMALRELNQRGDISQKVFARICNELLEQQQQCGMFDDLDLGALFEEKRAEVEIEKHASKAHKETQDELHAEIARLRTELEQEREQRQQVEQERDILRAELEQEREQRQQVEQERDTLRTEQTSQTTQDITHTPVIPFPRKTARKRTHKPAQVRQADVFGFTYQQLEMFSDEEIAQCQHNMHRSSIPTMPIMGNGAWSWYGTPMAA